MPEWDRFLEHVSRPEPTVFRVASRWIEPARLGERLAAQGFVVRPLDAMPYFFVVESGPRPLSHTYEHWAGLLYVQQASTGVAAPSLGAGPGDRVLDLCSSPGGKLCHLAEIVGEDGTLVANEIDERRMRGLLGNLYRLRVPNVLVIAGDGRSFPAGARFDRVLVDAPCSGEGTLRRRSGDVPDPSKRFRAYVTRAQRALLERAVELVRPGGTILYVTCTFAPEENEAVVSELLASAPVDVAPIDLPVPHAPGLTRFEGTTYDARLEAAVRIYPHHLDSGGLFMAKLRRLEGDADPHTDAGWRPSPAAFPGDDREEAEAERVVADCVEAVRERYGIERAFTERCRWMLRGDTIWAHRLREWPLEAWEPASWRAVAVGLRAIEIDTRGRPRATNDFLRSASGLVRESAVDVDRAEIADMLRGYPVTMDGPVPQGHVALRCGGDVVGRGRLGAAGLTSEIPKARAKDLLRALGSGVGSGG